MRGVFFLLFLAITILLWPPLPISAQDQDEVTSDEVQDEPEHVEDVELKDAEGRARFEAGRIAFLQGRYEDALVDFRRAFELTGRSALLYNVGTAAVRTGRDEEALDAYERFLSENPDSELRDEVVTRISLLRKALAHTTEEVDSDEQGDSEVDEVDEVQKAEVIPPTLVPGPEDDAPSSPWRIIGVVTAGVGLAVLGGSAYFGLRAKSLDSRSQGDGLCNADNVCTPEGLEHRDAAIRAATRGTITLITGGVLTAVGATLFFVGGPKASVEASPVIGPDQAGMSLQGRF